MNNNGILLLKTLLLSTRSRNILRYSKDKTKKRRIVAGTIGVALLYAMIMAYCIVMCIGYGTYGIIDSAPVMCALIISLIAFFFTLIKTNGYLFNFREYDMLMSLPFEAKTVAACKFLYMYVKSLPWYLSISLAIFNLIPISPLDGSKVLFSVLPDRQYATLMRYERYGMILMLLLVASGVLGRPLSTACSWVFSKLFFIAEWSYGLVT